jgi:hypothetical protein
MLKKCTYLWLLVLGMMLTGLSARAGDVRVKLERSGDGWLAWFPHQPVGIWTIQASNSGLADEWLALPGYEDDGVRVYARVPNVPKMFFRAKRVR